MHRARRQVAAAEQLSLFDGSVATGTRATSTPAPRARIVGVRAHGRPLLFLDFDGVIAWDLPGKTAMERLRRPAVALLNTIVERTGCLVVVSSMWRYDPRTDEGFRVPQLQAWLVEAGFVGEIIGITKHLPGEGVRGLEIQAWLVENDVAPGTRIAILDDWQPMGALSHRLVQTDYDRGLTVADAERVINLLGPR